MKRFAALSFVVVALTNPAVAGGPFRVFRSPTPSRSNYPANSRSSYSVRPAMSREQMDKVYGPSILLRDAATTDNSPLSSR